MLEIKTNNYTISIDFGDKCNCIQRKDEHLAEFHLYLKRFDKMISSYPYITSTPLPTDRVFSAKQGDLFHYNCLASGIKSSNEAVIYCIEYMNKNRKRK